MMTTRGPKPGASDGADAVGPGSQSECLDSPKTSFVRQALKVRRFSL
jgi:hypothetical protein